MFFNINKNKFTFQIRLNLEKLSLLSSGIISLESREREQLENDSITKCSTSLLHPQVMIFLLSNIAYKSSVYVALE